MQWLLDFSAHQNQHRWVGMLKRTFSACGGGWGICISHEFAGDPAGADHALKATAVVDQGGRDKWAAKHPLFPSFCPVVAGVTMLL